MNVGAGMRWSQSAKGWCGFVRPLSDGRLWVRHELTFKNLGPDIAADKIKSACKSWGVTVSVIYAQPELFPGDDTRGETVSQTFGKAGIVLRRGDLDPINGPSRLRSWLEAREWGPKRVKSPGLVIHPDCEYLLDTLPTLVEKAGDPDEVMTCIEEYPSLGLQFYLMSRPSPMAAQKLAIPKDAIYHDIKAMRIAAGSGAIAHSHSRIRE